MSNEQEKNAMNNGEASCHPITDKEIISRFKIINLIKRKRKCLIK